MNFGSYRQRDLVALRLDYGQMGVGGDTSWGARPHPQYTLPPREYAYEILLKPLSLEDGPDEHAKQESFRTWSHQRCDPAAEPPKRRCRTVRVSTKAA